MADTATQAKATTSAPASDRARRDAPRAAPSLDGAAPLIGLQHAAGNQAVVHLMRQPGTCLCQTCTCDENRQDQPAPAQRKVSPTAVESRAQEAVADLGPGQRLAADVRQDMEQRL